MIISERIFKLLKEKNISQTQFAKETGLANSTISDWKRKKTNPSADKIADICSVLKVTPEELLTGKGIDDDYSDSFTPVEYLSPQEKIIIESYQNLKTEQKKRFMAYLEALKTLDDLEDIRKDTDA